MFFSLRNFFRHLPIFFTQERKWKIIFIFFPYALSWDVLPFAGAEAHKQPLSPTPQSSVGSRQCPGQSNLRLPKEGKKLCMDETLTVTQCLGSHVRRLLVSCPHTTEIRRFCDKGRPVSDVAPARYRLRNLVTLGKEKMEHSGRPVYHWIGGWSHSH